MAQLVAAQPLDDGSYLFHPDDGGQPIHAWGPEADKLAAQLAQAPDYRVAGPGGAPPEPNMSAAPGGDPYAGGMSGGGPVASMSPPVRQGVTEAPAATQSFAASVPGAPPPDIAAPPPAAQVPQGTIAPQDFNAAVTAPVDVPYSAGRAAGFAPSTKAIEVQGAQPFDPEAAANRQQLSQAEMALREQAARQDEAGGRQQELQALGQSPEYAMRLADAQYRQQQVENAYKADRADLDAVIQENRAKTVDPGQWFHDKSTLGQIGIVLAQALGAFGSAITGTENFAQKEIDNQIERSIRAQEDQLRTGQVTANNMLAAMQRRYGDIDQAKAATRLALQDVAGNEAEKLAGATKSATAMQAYQQWAIDHLRARNEAEREFRAASEGKTNTTLNERYQQAIAAGGGYQRAPTLAEQARRAGQLADIAKGSRSALGIAEPDVQARVNAANAPKPPSARNQLQYAKTLNVTESAVGAAEEAAAAIGLTWDPGQQAYVRIHPNEDLPGVGMIDFHVKPYLRSQESQRVHQTLSAAKAMYTTALVGAGASQEKAQAVAEHVIGRGREQDVIDGLTIMRRQMQAQRDNLRAAEPEMWDKIHQGREQFNLERSTGTPGGLKPGDKAY